MRLMPRLPRVRAPNGPRFPRVRWGSASAVTQTAAAGTALPVASSAPLGDTDASERRRPRSLPRILFWYLVTVWFLLTLNFFLPRLLPGDPISTIINANSTNYVHDESIRAALATHYGFDKPLLVQYLRYLVGLFHGDLGVATQTGEPVIHEVAVALPWTLLLVGTGALVSATLAIVAGVAAAWRRGRPFDRSMIGIFTGFSTIPTFFLAALALLLTVKLGWFPLAGARDPSANQLGLLAQVGDVLYHVALPALVLGVSLAAHPFLTMRGAMVSELGSDYLLLGRAKGLSERRLKYRYAARNALLPTVTVIGLQVSFGVIAAIFVERLFAYPGIGGLLISAVVDERDYPTMQGCFLVITLVVITVNLLSDLAYRRLDPRTVA